MAELVISFRCLYCIFGYCAQNKKGMQVSSPNGAVSYIGYGAVCEENWRECKDYVKYTDIVSQRVPRQMEEAVEKPAKKVKEKVAK